MTMIDRLRAALGFKAAVTAPISAERVRAYSIFLGHRGHLTPRECWQMYLSVGTLAKVVDIIADGVAGLKPQLKIGSEIFDTHPVLDLLESPGFGRNRRRLMKELAVQYLVTGTAYPNMIGNLRAEPIAIDVLRSKDISITEGPDGWPGIYHLNESFRSAMFTRDPESQRDPKWIDGRFSQIIPILDMEGDQRGVGLSRLQSVQDDVNLKLTGLQHNRAMLANGASLSGIATIKGNVTPDQFSTLQRQTQERLSGAGNAGRILFTAGDGLDFKAVQQSNKDMDWANLIRTVDDSVIARYGVPTTIYNNDSQTYDNYKESWRALYENTIIPAFEVIASGLGNALSERYRERIEIGHDRLTNSVLADAAVDRAAKLLSERIITTNEAREMVGYEPLAGGDSIYDLPGMIPQYEDYFDSEGELIPRPAPSAQPQIEAGKPADGGAKALLKVVP